MEWDNGFRKDPVGVKDFLIEHSYFIEQLAATQRPLSPAEKEAFSKLRVNLRLMRESIAGEFGIPVRYKHARKMLKGLGSIF